MKAVELDRHWLKKTSVSGMLNGRVDIPIVLIQHYKELKLSDSAVMLLIHLISFTEKEQKQFPTIEEIQSRMSTEPDQVIQLIQQLLKEQWIQIDDDVDNETGIHFERYNLYPMYEKLAEVLVDRIMKEWEQEQEKKLNQKKEQAGEAHDIYTIFEQEFARPLTPMELETISIWLDKDQYIEELIRAALKEAVFSGKVSFRYIDRILLEWSRNRVFTIEQAREYTKQFRNRVERS